MRGQLLQYPASLPETPHVDTLARVAATFRDAIQTLRSSWLELRDRDRQDREFEALTGMSEHMLRDIGAPDRLISRASASRDAECWRLAALNRGYETLS